MQPRHQVPHRAQLAVGAVVYAIANAAALTLSVGERSTRWVPDLGMADCIVLALGLPLVSLLTGAVVLACRAVLWGARRIANR